MQATNEAAARFLDYEQAAEYTNISRWTLARKVKNGELKVVRVGRSIVRFDVRDLDRFMLERRN